MTLFIDETLIAPLFIFTGPANVLAPDNVNVPAPTFVKPNEPEITPDIVIGPFAFATPMDDADPSTTLFEISAAVVVELLIMAPADDKPVPFIVNV